MEKMKPNKLQTVILYVLENIGRPLGTIELRNIIYLIDVESATTNGIMMTGDTYVREEWGPQGINIRSSIEEMEGYEIKKTSILNEKSGITKRSHMPGDKPRFIGTLEPRDISVINSVFEKIEGLSPIQLTRMCFHTYPMEDIRAREDEEKLVGEELDFKVDDFDEDLLDFSFTELLEEKPDKAEAVGKGIELLGVTLRGAGLLIMLLPILGCSFACIWMILSN